jgi:hypothetical protein
LVAAGKGREEADRGVGVSMQGNVVLSVNIARGAARILLVGSESWGDLLVLHLISKN